MSAALPQARAGESAYEYVSEWRLLAPLADVWQALTEVEQWPRWWRYVRRVDTLRRGDADGLGALRRIAWTSRLPYGFTLEVECDRVQRHRLLSGAARGDLEGTGVWELSEDPDGSTRVRYTWRLALNTRWMRAVAPLMAPAFRWNHEGVMRAGAEGLAKHLGAKLIDA
ncbi:MAG TPA: SRPBCC family protein [Albitalea sp.]|uniref:SRPBCC family protein n=1 Tax=Piscinibacter sp. TaxID=1903157 RepID=UPI002ED3920F